MTVVLMVEILLFVFVARKIQEYNRAVSRQAEERELRERRERVRRAAEANRKAQEEAAKFAGDAGQGGMPNVDDFVKDPEIAAALKDPEIMNAFMDIVANPSNLMKYMSNPKVMKLFAKMKGGMAGMSADGASAGGCPTGAKCSDSGCNRGDTVPPPRPKAPEPDLD
uniref:STI1 domain-containing protein n=1 Tax=Angiostrongylus cantonensis TaxID=6313 RepID=A0A0K0CXF6_ANGCA